MASTMSWKDLLSAPQPCAHLVQVYSDESFLGRAVAHFVETGLAAGEAAAVIATPAHVEDLVDRLSTTGVDVRSAVSRGQLIVRDADACLPEFMVSGKPDARAFFGLVEDILHRSRAAGYPQIRLFGEMVNLLCADNLESTLELEALWNRALADHGGSLLCAYNLDNFDPDVHRRLLHQITRSHSYLIPVEDYDRLERAVDRAYSDIFGESGNADELRDLVISRHDSRSQMPPAQAALLGLRELGPVVARKVLDRARHHYGTS